ncbi:MAG TPA: hypothetical protein VMI31_03695 [Fimbriimonadaceae bacterium]|nr:hypothetical protein [Fimbriimonadaceae bacterium]
MTRCNWCGLVSEDDEICSWCKRPFAAHMAEGKSAEVLGERRRRRNLAVAVAGLLLILLVGVIGWQIRPTRRHATSSPSFATVAEKGRSPSGIPIPPAQEGRPRTQVVPPSKPSPSPALPPSTPDSIQDDNPAGDSSTPTLPLGSVQVVAASLVARDDNAGQEWAVGSVTVKNTGAYPVTDYRIFLRINDSEYSLTPFNGSISAPQAVQDRRIAPGAQIEVPVMTTTPYPTPTVVLSRSVIVRADVDGPPNTVSDSIPAVFG